MEVKFADTFATSLERMISREKWYWKTWFFFRNDIPRFLQNVWRFRKALWNYYWWDHHGTLRFLEIGLTHMSDNLETKGLEVDESRLKKVAAMRRAVQLIQNYNEDRYIEMAEAELGEIAHHPLEFKESEKEGFFEMVDRDTPEEAAHKKKVFVRAREIEEAEWKELWQLMAGQEHAKYQKLWKSISPEERKSMNLKEQHDHYTNWFDGSGMKGWWD
jgi:hypothetical protein